VFQRKRSYQFRLRWGANSSPRQKTANTLLVKIKTNIHDEQSVADALAGAYGVVNAVSLYVEHGQESFHSVHVEAAQRVATQAHRARAERLVHVSGIGADATSRSRYIRKRGEGELAVRSAFVKAILIRPAVMFGPDDAFLTTILRLFRRLPVYPMFGRGLTRLQPAYVEDVAEAIGRVMQRIETPSTIFELGGPRVYSYKEFLGAVAHQAGLAPLLVPIPFAVWHALAWTSEMFPSPRLTRNQVELMQIDTVSSPELGLPTLKFRRTRSRSSFTRCYRTPVEKSSGIRVQSTLIDRMRM